LGLGLRLGTIRLGLELAAGLGIGLGVATGLAWLPGSCRETGSGVGGGEGPGAGLGRTTGEGAGAEGLTEEEEGDDAAYGARYACQDASIVAAWSAVNWVMQLSGVYPCEAIPILSHCFLIVATDTVMYGHTG
jgi:hypothetical protein